MDLLPFVNRLHLFAAEARSIFGTDEASIHRIITLHETYDRLTALSAKQDDLLRQAMRCVEVQAFRAAHVMAWSALIDRLQEKISFDGFVALNDAFPKWQIKDLTDLRERYTDFSLLDASRAMTVLTKTQHKAFHGLLSKRNECAHPSEYYPDLNQSLGYVSEVITRMEGLPIE